MRIMARKLRPVRLAVHLPMAYRCDADYDAMSPVAGGRLCGSCDRVVHDLSAMSEREAARFMSRPRDGHRACLKYDVRPDGSVVYRKDDPPRLAAGLVVAALAACTPHEPTPQIADQSEIIKVEVRAPAVVVVPEAAAVATPVAKPEPRPEPPDDDINPCPPKLDDPPDPKGVKGKASSGPEGRGDKPPRHTRVVGIEG